MTKEQIEKVDELRKYKGIVEDYLKSFDPEYWVCCLKQEEEGVRKQDQYGNKGGYLKLYAYTNDESWALGNTSSKILNLFREFLEKVTVELQNRKTKLEQEIEEL